MIKHTMGNSNSPSKESLFNEFLNEEALQPEKKVEETLVIENPTTVSYTYAAPVAATEIEIKEQWREMRNYFRTGETTREAAIKGLMPVLLAPYLTQEELITDYPVFLSQEKENEHCTFPDLLLRIFQKTFKEGEAAVLLKNFPRMESAVRKYVAGNGNHCLLHAALEPAFHELSELKFSGEEGSRFAEDLDKFKKSFPRQGELLGFFRQTPIHLLVHLLKNQHCHDRDAFIKEVHHLKSGLQDLLSVEKVKSSKEQDLDFADSLIEFNKLDSLIPESASESMSKKRQDRIYYILHVLEAAENILLHHNGIIYIGKGLSANDHFKWIELFHGFELRIAPADESCLSVIDGFNLHISKLVKIMSAVRVAKLELAGKYDEDIHGEYFNRFNWHYFTEEETAACPPVVLIEETQHLLEKELSHFSALIASNKPIKVLAINQPESYKFSKEQHDEDAMISFQQELSALAISHRSTFTLQSSVHNPVHLLKGLQSGLASPAPVLFHILFSADQYAEQSRNFLDISSAVEGRQFPLFTYDAKGEKWGSRFDISTNPQADRDWPKYFFEVETHPNSHEIAIEKPELAFTYADCFAFNEEHAEHLFLVPPFCWSDDLIPLNEYLEFSTDQLYTKLPYIWLADKECILHKALVPYFLVIATKERQDFWNFIQELGGVNNFHVDQAISRTRAELQEQKEKALKDLENKYEQKLEEARATAAGEAMDRLANILLDLENISPAPAARITGKPVSPEKKEAATTETTVAPPRTDVAEKEAAVSNDPWVETFRCTSCNECTDKYPRAFKYDGEKQAYLDDPMTITFAQMVKAAEDCPAKCIHPGMPLNPNEPGLEELLKRAKPFN